MMKSLATIFSILSLLFTGLLLTGCGGQESGEMSESASSDEMTIDDRLDQYTSFELNADLSQLSDNQRQIISLLIDAGQAMEEVFWMEAYGDKSELMDQLDSEQLREFAEINYGPWDRLNGDEPFVDGFGPKPAGANFYPADMTKEEFEAWDSETKDDLYTLVRRDESGNLMTIPYHEEFAEQHQLASEKLREAAELAEDLGLREYLNLRAEALLTDDYQASDMAWLDMKENTIEVVIGPIETYEDQLYGYKAAHETFVLIKDQEWSDRLSRYAEVLPELQEGLPVPEEYKQEEPGRDSDLNAYDAVYYAGDANAGSKTIAINLPNDEEVQLAKGTRRLQLKNAMRAKYDKILVDIADMLIVEEQRQYLTFDAFFSNTMFHEVAHGLGIKNTINGNGTVREALREHSSALEEGKADVLGLYMINELRNDGMVTDGSIEENYTTFVASIFRSIRFGTSSAHGMANLIRFNYFVENGAITYDDDQEAWRVEFDQMQEVTNSLSNRILTFQGDGDYEGVANFVEEYGQMMPQLQNSLDRLANAGIPTDIVFEQGKDVLGIE
ncbi:Zn-dependent hydrolase [Rhodohalobacter sp. WB101]|uniref:Zn-dependent hydrolase n=2 Tax=Rhodohalobacter sulfatireducens TaxID=2911366 RepID=A0ABS9KBB0_9BACT|nr:Zn-dependent hydrolase [Rhodohalobacter sulfatireducens]MCG2588137.1 Zn-dependent hydrolase [Rhodohalobacter sulfatireducens]